MKLYSFTRQVKASLKCIGWYSRELITEKFNKPLLSDNILNIWVDENQCSAKLIVVKRLLPISHEMLGLTTEVEK